MSESFNEISSGWFNRVDQACDSDTRNVPSLLRDTAAYLRREFKGLVTSGPNTPRELGSQKEAARKYIIKVADNSFRIENIVRAVVIGWVGVNSTLFAPVFILAVMGCVIGVVGGIGMLFRDFHRSNVREHAMSYYQGETSTVDHKVWRKETRNQNHPSYPARRKNANYCLLAYGVTACTFLGCLGGNYYRINMRGAESHPAYQQNPQQEPAQKSPSSKSGAFNSPLENTRGARG